MKRISSMTDAEYIDHLEVQVQDLAKALKSLRNDASGFLSMADKYTHGSTNMMVLQHWIDNADKELAKCQPGDFK